MPHRNLDTYMRWVLEQPLSTIRGALHEVYHYGYVAAYLLHREPPFQTELVLLLPKPGGHEVGPHSHPTVDSREIILHGEVHFTIDGEPLYPPRLIHRFAPHLASVKVPPIIVPAGVVHSARVSAEGGSFLSIQEWLPGGPPMSTVGLDWADGAPLNDVHAQALEVTP